MQYRLKGENMTNKLDEEFFKNLNFDKGSIAEIVKNYNLWKGDIYDGITRIGARKTNTPISANSIKNLYKSVYDCWYEYLKQKNLSAFSEQQKSKINVFLSMPKYQKENMSAEDCYKFVHSGYDKLLKGCAVRPMSAQNMNQGIIDKNGAIYPDFVHCFPFSQPEQVDCRLYLNMKPENIAELSDKLLKKCFDKRLKLYFKFWTNDNRNDTFLVYTNYKRVQTMVSILKEIKKENPKLFEGCETINPLLANIDNFIGFGEEPKYKHSSFNSERADAIAEFSKEVVGKGIAEERKRIAKFSGTLLTSKGKNLKLEDYLVYRLEQSFKDTIIDHQKDIVNRKYPRYYEGYGSKAVSSYIQMENKIYRACTNELPQFVKQQIKIQANKYLEGLKNGQNVFIQPIKFATDNFDLFPGVNKDYLNEEMKRKGHLEYSFQIKIDMQEKLFTVFNSEENIKKCITDDAIEPYLKRHHVSSKYPALNIESENKVIECDKFSQD